MSVALRNEIAVLIGNMVGGFVIGAVLCATYSRDVPARRAAEQAGTLPQINDLTRS
jgi:hypothetical protein